jgi:RNA recognition motif-containing protein
LETTKDYLNEETFGSSYKSGNLSNRSNFSQTSFLENLNKVYSKYDEELGLLEEVNGEDKDEEDEELFGKFEYEKKQSLVDKDDKNKKVAEHPLGEHPSRTLFVRNISSNLSDEELRKIFEEHGAIRNMYTQCKHRGFVMISYYDIRHSKNAMKHLNGKIIKKRKIDIHYSIPKENPSEKDVNQGTLVVFNLDPNVTNEELMEIFGKYGEVKVCNILK